MSTPSLGLISYRSNSKGLRAFSAEFICSICYPSHPRVTPTATPRAFRFPQGLFLNHLTTYLSNDLLFGRLSTKEKDPPKVTVSHGNTEPEGQSSVQPHVEEEKSSQVSNSAHRSQPPHSPREARSPAPAPAASGGRSEVLYSPDPPQCPPPAVIRTARSPADSGGHSRPAGWGERGPRTHGPPMHWYYFSSYYYLKQRGSPRPATKQKCCNKNRAFPPARAARPGPTCSARSSAVRSSRCCERGGPGPHLTRVQCLRPS